MLEDVKTYDMSHKADQVKILVDVAVDCGMEKSADLFKYLFERVYHVPNEAANFEAMQVEIAEALNAVVRFFERGQSKSVIMDRDERDKVLDSIKF